MDILNPKILNIEGRLYINYSEEETLQNQSTVTEEHNLEEPVSFDTEKKRDTVKNLKKLIKCPNALFKYVIGYRGETKRKIETETNSKITIPQRGQSGDIWVSSKSMKDIDAATTRIELLLSEKRWREPFAHFISIPLMDESIKDGFRNFKTQVMTKCSGDQGITERLFQNENKLHLTIGTLFLLDEDECEKAIDILKQIIKSDLLSKVQYISVKGVEYMNDDPQMIDVLYAKVSCPKDPNFLQNLADYIASKYQSAGLMKKEHDHVKLHATVMNTIRTVEKTRGFNKTGKPHNKRETFDGRKILKDFENYKFGETALKEVHISKRHTADKSGYYESLFVGKMQTT